MEVKFFLNDVEVTYNVKPGEYLLDTLRNNGVLSLHKSCNESCCGNCTVLVDNKPVLSCSMLTVRAEGKHITTVEGVQEVASRIADLFAEQGSDQCGYCGSAMALTIYALSLANPQANDEEIKDFMVGNLCRCSGYQGQFIAAKKYLEEVNKNGK